MKSSKEFITERLDDLALEHHSKFYCDLSKELQETIWMMANKEYNEYVYEIDTDQLKKLESRYPGNKGGGNG